MTIGEGQGATVLNAGAPADAGRSGVPADQARAGLGAPRACHSRVAALYVQTGGCYFGVDGVDPWDEPRDARTCLGPLPAVAHPPCQRWGRMWFGQPLTVKRTGVRKIKGDDDGCFAHAYAYIRANGGVIEHPWGSHAWPHFGIAVPPRAGGWIATGDGGWTCCVEQGRYGHYARKPTLLVVHGVDRADLPELDWGKGEARLDPAVVERMGLARAKRLGEVGGRGGGKDSSPRIGTPIAFRDVLLNIARSVHAPASERLSPHDPHTPPHRCQEPGSRGHWSSPRQWPPFLL